MNITESSVTRAALERAVAALVPSRGPADAEAVVATGVASLDAAIGGGLARARLHELIAPEAGDAGAAAGFAAMLARRLGGPALWLREAGRAREGGLHAPGLAELGMDPDALVLALPRDPLALLRAAADVVRCPGVGVAVIELWQAPRALDLTATRRLALAAEESGVTPLLLRIDAAEAPSAARTRWQVVAHPSRALAANAPGHSCLSLTLLRQRGGAAGGQWIVEWDRDRAVFVEAGTAQPALSGAVAAAAADRPAARLPA